MIKRIWQRLVQFLQRLFGRGRSARSKSSAPAAKQLQTLKPLDNSDYEFLFMQLLEGVAHGWQQHRILKFFADLEGRATEASWVEWLRGFGERLLASAAPNQELAIRMLTLEQIGCGEIGEMAGIIGSELLQRQQAPQQSEVDLNPSLFVSLQEGEEMETQTQAITLDQLWELLQQDPNLVQQLADLLQIDTNDPQVVMDAIVNQASGATQA